MKLLICTQVVDMNDPVLGFFHDWIVEFAGRYEHVTVICLKQGRHTLPRNVTVYSLGKEQGNQSKIKYALRFIRFIVHSKHEYDAVFVHMNQEFILLGSVLWKMWGKCIYFWRNHYAGSVLTHIAVNMSDKAFYTSHLSYTARFVNAVRMPLGIRMGPLVPVETRQPRSILSVGRISPSKRLEILIEALGELHRDGQSFTASIYGPTQPEDAAYLASLKERVRQLGIEHLVSFFGSVTHAELPHIYSRYDIFVNLSQSGMYDKTMLEAAICGTLVIAASDDFATDVGKMYHFDGTAPSLAQRLTAFLAFNPKEKQELRAHLAQVAELHSLKTLVERLTDEIV